MRVCVFSQGSRQDGMNRNAQGWEGRCADNHGGVGDGLQGEQICLCFRFSLRTRAVVRNGADEVIKCVGRAVCSDVEREGLFGAASEMTLGRGDPVRPGSGYVTGVYTHGFDGRDVPLGSVLVAWMFESDLVEGVFEDRCFRVESFCERLDVVVEGPGGD